MEDLRKIKSRCITLEITLKTKIGNCIKFLTSDLRVDFYSKHVDLIKDIRKLSFMGFNWNPMEISRSKPFFLLSDWRKAKEANEIYQSAVSLLEDRLSEESLKEESFIKEVAKAKYYESFMNRLLHSVGLFTVKIFEAMNVAIPVDFEHELIYLEHAYKTLLAGTAAESDKSPWPEVPLEADKPQQEAPRPEVLLWADQPQQETPKELLEADQPKQKGQEVLLEADQPQQEAPRAEVLLLADNPSKKCQKYCWSRSKNFLMYCRR